MPLGLGAEAEEVGHGRQRARRRPGPTPRRGRPRRRGRGRRSRDRRSCGSFARRAPRTAGSSGRPGRATAARACAGGRAGRRWRTCGWASATIHGTVRSDVRRLKVVASLALIAILAVVAVPDPVGSRAPSPAATVDPDLFRRVEVAALARGTSMTIQPQDPGARSAGSLDQRSILIEPDLRTEPTLAPVRPAQRVATPTLDQHEPLASRSRHLVVRAGPLWQRDRVRPEADQDPGRGRPSDPPVRDARHLPLQGGHADRARHRPRPYVSGRTWDLSHGACAKLGHCFTGTIDWQLAAHH